MCLEIRRTFRVDCDPSQRIYDYSFFSPKVIPGIMIRLSSKNYVEYIACLIIIIMREIICNYPRGSSVV